jgi:crotonobetainyl-CoA:carnitine CoA-transferase CaiB-like acyl-CoA transferase
MCFDEESRVSQAGLFAGVRIVELAYFIFVPGASCLLADQGAEVIKVEAVGGGDPYRTVIIGDGREYNNMNLAMEQNNRGKKSIAVNLKSADGRAVLLDLIRSADIFVTGLRPKALTSLKLDVDDLRAVNPKLIYARGNGLGFRGEEANKPGFDASAFYARGGLADLVTRPGQPVVPPRTGLGDHTACLSLAYAMAGALYHRLATGEPTVVESSLLATAMWVLSGDVTFAQQPGYKLHHDPVYRFPLMTPYATQDGVRIQLMLLDPEAYWPSFCRLVGLEALQRDPRFVDNAARLRNSQELIDIIADRFVQRSWAEWQPLFAAFDAPWELIRTVHDVRKDPQVVANEMIYDIAIGGNEQLMLVSSPAVVDGRPFAGGPKRAPQLGQHTDEVLRSIGYAPESIAQMKEAGVIQ